MPSTIRYRRLLSGVFALSLTVAALRAAPPSDVPGVSNFHQVDENVYRGAQPHGEGFANLANIGIRTVIDLRGEASEQSAVNSAGMHYVRLPWSGYKAPTNSEIQTVLTLLNDSSNWPVFVHCKRGADRTGTAIACYRIAHDHWSTEQALAEARSFGMRSFEIAMQHYIQRFGAQAAESATILSPASPLP